MTKTFALQPHPTAPCSFVTIDVVAEMTTTLLRCTYNVRGTIDRLAVPVASARPQHTDGLWQHTCFEAFIAPAGSDAYFELNFSPSGDWAAYRFDAYREGMAQLEIHQPPQVTCETTPDHLVLAATIDIPDIPIGRLALSAVLEDRDGHRYYWALRHAQGKPDFHHRSGFVDWR